MRLLRILFSIAIVSSLAALPAYAQRGGHGGGGGARSSGGGARAGGGFSGGGSRGFSSGGFSPGSSHGGFSGGTAFRGGTNFGTSGGGGFNNGGFHSGGFPNRGFTNGFRGSGFVGRGFRGGYYPGYSFGVGYFGYPYYGYYGGDPYYGYYDPYYGPSSGSSYDPNDYNYGSYISQPDYTEHSAPVTITPDYQQQRVGPPQLIPAPGSEQDSFYRPADFYLIAFTNHTIQAAVSYTVEGDTLRYTTREHVERTAPLSSVDVGFSERINRDRHVDFRLP